MKLHTDLSSVLLPSANVNSENPLVHWQFARPLGQRVLDLGCGIFGGASKESDHSVKYFLDQGAIYVHGIDTNVADLEFLRRRYAPEIATGTLQFQECRIGSAQDILSLVEVHKITAMKIDIEGDEQVFLEIPHDEFRQIEQYWVEIHYEHLATEWYTKLQSCGYAMDAVIHLVHAGPVVYFAHRC